MFLHLLFHDDLLITIQMSSSRSWPSSSQSEDISDLVHSAETSEAGISSTKTPQLEVSSSGGTFSLKFSQLISGGLRITEASGQSTSTGDAVYDGEAIPNLRGTERVPQYFILKIQNASARLILTKDTNGRAEVVFDKVYEGAQVPQLEGVYAGTWTQLFIPNM